MLLDDIITGAARRYGLERTWAGREFVRMVHGNGAKAWAAACGCSEEVTCAWCQCSLGHRHGCGCRYLGGRNGTGAARRGYQLKIT